MLDFGTVCFLIAFCFSSSSIDSGIINLCLPGNLFSFTLPSTAVLNIRYPPRIALSRSLSISDHVLFFDYVHNFLRCFSFSWAYVLHLSPYQHLKCLRFLSVCYSYCPGFISESDYGPYHGFYYAFLKFSAKTYFHQFSSFNDLVLHQQLPNIFMAPQVTERLMSSIASLFNTCKPKWKV